jgi:hypothetical protein
LSPPQTGHCSARLKHSKCGGDSKFVAKGVVAPSVTVKQKKDRFSSSLAA